MAKNKTKGGKRKNNKSKKSPKTKTTPVSKPVVSEIKTSTPTPAPASTTPVSTTPVSTTSVSTPAKSKDLLLELLNNVDGMISANIKHNKSVRSELKKIRKEYNKVLRKNKKNRQKKRGGKPRAPSGFAKPGPVSKELCKFVGVKAGTDLARTFVTKFMTKYIKEHDLQNPKNKREVFADSKMRQLLGLKKNDVITFFTMQKFMAPHFIKKSTVVSS